MCGLLTDTTATAAAADDDDDTQLLSSVLTHPAGVCLLDAGGGHASSELSRDRGTGARNTRGQSQRRRPPVTGSTVQNSL